MDLRSFLIDQFFQGTLLSLDSRDESRTEEDDFASTSNSNSSVTEVVMVH